jgi:hypothetical protein
MHPIMQQAANDCTKTADFKTIDGIHISKQGTQAFEFFDFRDYLKPDKPA